MTKSHSVNWSRVIVIAIPCGLLFFGLLWVFAGRYIPSHRAQLFRNPVSAIQSIEIRPGDNASLVANYVVVSNSATIHEIMTAIRSANSYSPNHPVTRWDCLLVITSSSGADYVDVNESVGQGTILYCKTSSNGMIFDTLQSKTLGNILERETAHR